MVIINTLKEKKMNHKGFNSPRYKTLEGNLINAIKELGCETPHYSKNYSYAERMENLFRAFDDYVTLCKLEHKNANHANELNKD